MNPRLLFILGLVAFLAACQSRSEQAALYNDRIVDQQFQLIQAVESLDTLLLTRDASTMQDALVLVKGEVIRSQRLLDSLGAFQQDTTLLEGARQLFNTYADLSSQDYPDMIRLLEVDAPADTLAHLEQIYAVQAEIHAQRTATYEAFFQAQQSFGKKFNLEFEERNTEH